MSTNKQFDDEQYDGGTGSKVKHTSSTPTTTKVDEEIKNRIIVSSPDTNNTSTTSSTIPTTSTTLTTLTSNKATTLRDQVGKSLSFVSDSINDHIIVARYGTVAAVSLLTVYGISQTPLLFRYRNVAEIPARWFLSRRKIYGRIVSIVEQQPGREGRSMSLSRSKGGNNFSNSTSGKGSEKALAERPIVCLVRHLSPMGRIMNRNAFDFLTCNSPTSSFFGGGLDSKSIDDAKNLMKVEIAGICLPPPFTDTKGEREGEWLRNLAANRRPVVCTLLSRRIVTAKVNSVYNHPLKTPLEFSPDDNNNQSDTTEGDDDDDLDNRQVAVCNVAYRPPGNLSLFRTDLAFSLVQTGRAAVVSSSSGVHADVTSTKIIDCSGKIEDVRRDARYLERLEELEFDALKERIGMWSVTDVRSCRPDLVEEAEFQRTAGTLKKVWRWMRRGR